MRMTSPPTDSMLGPHVYVAVSSSTVYVAEFTTRYDVLTSRRSDITTHEWVDVIVEAEGPEIRIKVGDLTVKCLFDGIIV